MCAVAVFGCSVCAVVVLMCWLVMRGVVLGGRGGASGRTGLPRGFAVGCGVVSEGRSECGGPKGKQVCERGCGFAVNRGGGVRALLTG